MNRILSLRLSPGPWRLCAVLAGVLSAPFHPVLAQSDDSGDTRFMVGDMTEIVVTGREDGSRVDIPGSVDLINRDQLRNEHVNLTMDLFKKVPGVTFSRFNQGIIAADIAIRGFNAEGTMPATKLLIDGIPSNLHVGVPEMDALFPMEIDHIEVVKGTNDPRYGLLNVAGNINMTSRRDISREVEVLAGSFDTYEAQGYAGLESGDWSQHYFLGRRDTDGYRDNAGLDKTTVSGKWFYEPDEQLSFGVIARYFEFNAEAPGFLTGEQARAHPRMSVDFSDTDGGRKETVHLSAHLDYAITETLDWTARVYGQNFERQRWVRFTEGRDQQERFEDERQTGFTTTLAWNAAPGTLLRWGFDYEAQDNVNQRFVSEERSRGAATRDHQFDYDVYGSYVQVQQDVGSRLRLIGAVRADRLRGDFTDHRSGEHRDMNEYGTIWQPKFSALYTVNDRIDLFANAGRSFQVGVRSAAFPADGRDVDASVNDGWDLGVSVRPVDAVALRLSRWGQSAADELVQKADGSGDFENIGTTHRDGWELTANWWISEAWTLWGSYSWQEATLTNPGPLNTGIRGNDLHHVPDYTASLGLEYQRDRLTTTLFTSFQGDYELNNQNDRGRFGDYALTDLTVRYALGPADVSLRVINLFDQYFEYVWHDSFFTGENLHSPGAGRSVDVSVAYAF